MKLTPRTKVQINKNVIFKTVDDEVFILDTKNSTVHTLNNTASYIWRKIQKPTTFEEVNVSITKKFKVSPTTATDDSSEFITKYIKFGYIKVIR